MDLVWSGILYLFLVSKVGRCLDLVVLLYLGVVWSVILYLVLISSLRG